MTKNMKPEYINKMRKIEAPNGYKFDIANYLYNPAYGYEYPAFFKKISEDENTETYRRVYYFKYWDGHGEYKAEVYTMKKDGGNWQVIHTISDDVLEESNRYNVNKILQYCA